MGLWTTGLVAALWLAATSSTGQVGYLWSPDELRVKSDVVVIAASMGTRATGVRSDLLELRPGYPVIELHTEFKVLSVLKGALAQGTFVLRHYRADPARLSGGTVGGAHPLPVVSGGHYLLFLRRDAGEIFVPTSGQVFPADSVFTLRKAG